ncbi:methyltransferase [Kordiimonas sediminis]|uniref:Methyltransferase n=1 Tax=Kordiimonas sediminis TaxID=1735581 RepID=A0A919AS18_9PROT|nr:class I SAM-dependent methyltransferase [Kordiimonas sediminis]GHF24238.1 methyltransferase [Kordiimonas sediminis]
MKTLIQKAATKTFVAGALAAAIFSIGSVQADNHGDGLKAAVEGPARSDANKARDQYRHPYETLKFMGVKPDMTVVEISPGSSGWYMEILAPYLKDSGTYYAASYDGDSDSTYQQNGAKAFAEKLASNPSAFGAVKTTVFAKGKYDIAPAGSADVVLTFRNVHNWMSGDNPFAEDAFKAFAKALKPGGVLGVVEHRAKGATGGGYVAVEDVIKLAEAAGLKLMDQSEVNANPKDTADHPKGVWTLPPRLAAGDENRDKYLAIGESDRMTLKFVKPE